EQHRRADMNRLRPPPVDGIDPPNRTEGPRNPRIVDQKVDRPEHFLDLRHRMLDRCRIGDVAANPNGAAATGTDGLSNCVELRQRAGKQRHRSAFLGEALGNRLSEASAGSGNQRDLSLQNAHRDSSAGGSLSTRQKRFAKQCLKLERAKGFEPSTPTLAKLHRIFSHVRHSTPLCYYITAFTV